jgi:hypothetical protein
MMPCNSLNIPHFRKVESIESYLINFEITNLIVTGLREVYKGFTANTDKGRPQCNTDAAYTLGSRVRIFPAAFCPPYQIRISNPRIPKD